MRAAIRLPLLTTALLVACSDPSAVAPGPSTGIKVVGTDRDAHGCIASAGYRWCAAAGECERPWELAKEKGLPATPEAFDRYCENDTP